ncbi:MAG: CdaR family protein [Nitrospiraceae bacterium]|nr:CdaR family protein [Nitrospiraceae bacterium]
MRKLLLENAGLKISAILLSVLLWFFVTSRGQSEMSLQIPIEFKNIPVGLGIVNTSAKSVNVTVRGQERLMKSVKSSDIRVFIDLSKAKKGEGNYHINSDDVRLPYAMSVANVDPSAVKILLDETAVKSVRVDPVVSGTPEQGFYVKSVQVDPKTIVVRGLKTELRRIAEVKTDVMDISGMNETTTQELNIDVAGANIKPDTSTVKVTVVIGGKRI